MQQASSENIIIADFGQVWLRRSGLIQVTFAEGIAINYQHAKALLLIIRQLSVHSVKPILIDFRPARSITREARLALMGERAAEVKESVAFVVQSRIIKMLINLALLVSRPSFHAHCFGTEDGALRWLGKTQSYQQIPVATGSHQAMSA